MKRKKVKREQASRVEPLGRRATRRRPIPPRRFRRKVEERSTCVTFALTVLVAWELGAFAYIYFYPRLLYNALERAIVQRGLGATASGGRSSGIPVDTLYSMSELASPSTLKSNLLEGTNHDTLYTIGWLDLSRGPQVLQVPDMADRYYSIEFVDPWGDVFAYVGRRTTGARAGDYLICGPGWQGKLPNRVIKISLAEQHRAAYRTSAREK